MKSSRMISCICVTCARVRHLENAIAAFLAQDYTEPHELVILNTCFKQELSLEVDRPRVRIINLPHRPPSLGHARNIAIAAAQGAIIVIHDDDDFFLPHHLSSIAAGFEQTTPDRSVTLDPRRTSCEWIWLKRQFWGWGPTIKEIVKGQCPCFAFTKHAWEAVGGYDGSLTVGEDRLFISRVTRSFPGNYVEVPGTPSFIYCWNNGVYHTSGQGDDSATHRPAHDRYWEDAMHRMNAGMEPTGKVVLKPRMDVDWPRLASDFMAKESKKKSMSDLVIVQLGRFGDIVNMLPIALRIHNTVGKPALMVSKEFASILDGVSYVTPYVVGLANDQVTEAIALAKREFKHVIVTQIWGKNWQGERRCASYNMESWRAAGFLHKFNDPTWRPLFDLRDSEREIAAVEKLSTGKLPMLLVNTTHSTSSPWPYGKAILNTLRVIFEGHCEIVDIGQMRLHRIYDAIGLLEHAAVLVSIDTALLHLAACVNVPTVAIVNQQPWLGTTTRNPFYTTTLTYDEAQNVTKLAEAVRYRLNQNVPFMLRDVPMGIIPSPAPVERKLYHVYEQHEESNPIEMERKQTARASWQALYAQGVIPVPLTPYPRNAQVISDPRKLPFLRDCLEPAMKKARDEDIIFFTNDDNVLHPGLPDALRLHVAMFDCCTSQRCEFKHAPMPPLTWNPDVIAAAADTPHMGRDLFAFTGKWLREHWGLIPDFILGASDFDLCLASMVRMHFGIQSNRQNLEQSIFPAEIPRGYVSHRCHNALWGRPGNVDTAPSQIHNRNAFRKWAEVYLPDLKFHKNNVI